MFTFQRILSHFSPPPSPRHPRDAYLVIHSPALLASPSHGSLGRFCAPSFSSPASHFLKTLIFPLYHSPLICRRFIAYITLLTWQIIFASSFLRIVRFIAHNLLARNRDCGPKHRTRIWDVLPETSPKGVSHPHIGPKIFTKIYGPISSGNLFSYSDTTSKRS